MPRSVSSSGNEQASGNADSSNTKDSSSNAANLARIRDNQRRSRARRREYLNGLETKLRNCELAGVQASREIQEAARRVLDENRKLRMLLESRGISGKDVDEWVAGMGLGVFGPESSGAGVGVSSRAVEDLDWLLTAPRPCNGESSTPIPATHLRGQSVSSVGTSAPPELQGLHPGPVPNPLLQQPSSAYSPNPYPQLLRGDANAPLGQYPPTASHTPTSNFSYAMSGENTSTDSFTILPGSAAEPLNYQNALDVSMAAESKPSLVLPDDSRLPCMFAADIIANMIPGARISLEEIERELRCPPGGCMSGCAMDSNALWNLVSRYTSGGLGDAMPGPSAWSGNM